MIGLTSCSTAAVHEHTDVDIVDGWVRVSEYSDHIGGMTGAFAKFTNNTDHVVTIMGGMSDIAGMIQTHEVVMNKGAMVMQEKEGGIAIEPGKSVTLEPGGLHLMFMGLNQAVLEGDKVTFTIDFEGTEDVTVTWPAKASLAGDETYQPKN
jgi:copper(I)-binding protein